MPRKATAPKLAPFSMRFTPELKARLQALADGENRSMSNYLETRIPKWIEAEEAAVKAKRRP